MKGKWDQLGKCRQQQQQLASVCNGQLVIKTWRGPSATTRAGQRATHPGESLFFPTCPDLEFAADAVVTLGPGIQQRGLELESFSNAALETLTPLLEATQPLRSFTAKSVASTRDVAGSASFTALLRRPDRTQASVYLPGLKLVGGIPASGLNARFLVKVRVL